MTRSNMLWLGNGNVCLEVTGTSGMTTGGGDWSRAHELWEPARVALVAQVPIKERVKQRDGSAEKGGIEKVEKGFLEGIRPPERRWFRVESIELPLSP